MNLGLCLALCLVHLAWLAGLAPLIVVPLMLVATPAWWALIHEAIHGGLLSTPTANQSAGRLLAIIHGAPFGILRLGHLLHHKYSRTLDASEVYDPEVCPHWLAVIRHYTTILGGLYLGEVVAGLISHLPASWRTRLIRRLIGDNALSQRFIADLQRPEALRAARLDILLSAIVYAGAFVCWGEHGGWLLASLLLRGAIVSFFDNAYHYATPLGGNVLEVRNHRLPAWAGWLILNFHWHGLHHRQPNTAWIDLPRAAAEIGLQASGPGFFSGALQQLRGPIGEAGFRKRFS